MPKKLKNALFRAIVTYLYENDSNSVMLVRLFADTNLPIGEKYGNLTVFAKAWKKATDKGRCFIVNYLLFQEALTHISHNDHNLVQDDEYKLFTDISNKLDDVSEYTIGFARDLEKYHHCGTIRMKYLKKNGVIHNDFDNPLKLKLPVSWKRCFEVIAILSSFSYTLFKLSEDLYHLMCDSVIIG